MPPEEGTVHRGTVKRIEPYGVVGAVRPLLLSQPVLHVGWGNAIQKGVVAQGTW
jgi:hypothetical protein